MKQKNFERKNLFVLNRFSKNRKLFSLRTVIIYLIVGFLWILFSDQVLKIIVENQELYIMVQTYKGFFYVLITAGMLFVLIKVDSIKILKFTEEIENKNQKLLAYSREMADKEEELRQKVEHLKGVMQELSLQKEFVENIYKSSNAAILIWDKNCNIVEANRFFGELSGYPHEELSGCNWCEIFISEEEQDQMHELIENICSGSSVSNFETRIKTKDGGFVYMIWNHVMISNPNGDGKLIASFGIDISLEKENEKRVYELAFKDNLTGLKNRTVFESDVLKKIVAKEEFTIYYLDFDNFKNLNDVHGHTYGDLFLKNFSQKLVGIFGKNSVYRWCGDEFAIIEDNIFAKKREQRIAQIMKISKEKWMIDHIEYYPSISIGTTEHPKDAETMEKLFKNIDLAIHHAKSNGKSKASAYREAFQLEVEQRIAIENKINSGLREEEFMLYYQPIFDFETGHIKDIEALLRWNGDLTQIGTGELISVAEQTGQILHIDLWVIQTAFEFVSEYLSDYDVVLSVNLSAKSIASKKIIGVLKSYLIKYAIMPGKIQFELTEYSLVQNLDTTKDLIHQLKQMGFKVALDDFGTKYSSLNYLGNIPFDSLKIDKSYVDKIVEDKNSRIIVEQIIALSKQLGLKTIAEGIEYEEQHEVLVALNCNCGQGYLFHRPMEKEKIIHLLELQSIQAEITRT